MMKQKFEMAKLKDGTPIWISESGEVYVIDENMEKVPIFDGEHILTSGEIIATVNGKITERRKETEAEAEVISEEAPKDAVKCEEEVELAEPAEPIQPSETSSTDSGSQISKEDIVAIIKPLLDDIYSKIADLQTAIETAGAGDVIEDVVNPEDYKKSKMSAIDSYIAYINSTKK